MSDTPAESTPTPDTSNAETAAASGGGTTQPASPTAEQGTTGKGDGLDDTPDPEADPAAGTAQADQSADEKPEWVTETHGPVPEQFKDQYRVV